MKIDLTLKCSVCGSSNPAKNMHKCPYCGNIICMGCLIHTAYGNVMCRTCSENKEVRDLIVKGIKDVHEYKLSKRDAEKEQLRTLLKVEE